MAETWGDAEIETLRKHVQGLHATVEAYEKLVGDLFTLVEDSRRGFHDSTVWEDEDYVGDWIEPGGPSIAKRWSEVRERAAGLMKGTDR